MRLLYPPPPLLLCSQLLKKYKNDEFNTPYQHAVSATQCCMEVPRWNNDDKLKAMEGVLPSVVAMAVAVAVFFPYFS